MKEAEQPERQNELGSNAERIKCRGNAAAELSCGGIVVHTSSSVSVGSCIPAVPAKFGQHTAVPPARVTALFRSIKQIGSFS